MRGVLERNGKWGNVHIKWKEEGKREKYNGKKS
jgi:hypothetical protein